jgi:hypothetical protein
MVQTNRPGPTYTKQSAPLVTVIFKEPGCLGFALFFIIVSAILTSALIIYLVTHILRLFI